MEARGAELMGAVVNKVWPEKYTRVKKAATKGMLDIASTHPQEPHGPRRKKSATPKDGAW